MGNIREKMIGFGFARQSAIATPNTVDGIWRLNKLNTSFAGPRLNTENDAAELGKGHEFPSQVFKTSWDAGGQIEKYLSSDFAAWAMAFGLGKSVKSGSAPNLIYTSTPLDPPADGIELPVFSYIEQIRPGAGVILDRMAVGCAVNSWTLTVGSGPGRANSKLVVEIVGTGKHKEPSGIELPAATLEKLLPSSSLACTINGVNYVSSKNIVSLEAAWRNNIRMDSGFYPGSGFQGWLPQVDTITLTGAEGTANVTLAGGLTKLVTYGDSLTDTAADFVTSHAAAYLAVGIVVTSDGPDIIFTASDAETSFTHPQIANATGDLAGTVENTQAATNDPTSGAIRGRMEVGDRECALSFVSRFAYGSTELAKLKAQTEGTAVVSLSYDANNSLGLTYQRLQFAVVELGDTDGIITVQVTCTPLMHSDNGLLTAVAKCNTDGIAEAES